MSPCHWLFLLLIHFFAISIAFGQNGYGAYAGLPVEGINGAGIAGNGADAAENRDGVARGTNIRKAPIAPVAPPRIPLPFSFGDDDEVAATHRRAPPPPTRREVRSEGQCQFDPTKWRIHPQSAAANAIMFDRTSGLSCNECLELCANKYQSPSNEAWICRSVTYDHRWRICDLFAVNGTGSPYFLVDYKGRDYFSFLAALPPTDKQLNGHHSPLTNGVEKLEERDTEEGQARQCLCPCNRLLGDKTATNGPLGGEGDRRSSFELGELGNETDAISGSGQKVLSRVGGGQYSASVSSAVYAGNGGEEGIGESDQRAGIGTSTEPPASLPLLDQLGFSTPPPSALGPAIRPISDSASSPLSSSVPLAPASSSLLPSLPTPIPIPSSDNNISLNTLGDEQKSQVKEEIGGPSVDADQQQSAATAPSSSTPTPIPTLSFSSESPPSADASSAASNSSASSLLSDSHLFSNSSSQNSSSFADDDSSLLFLPTSSSSSSSSSLPLNSTLSSPSSHSLTSNSSSAESAERKAFSSKTFQPFREIRVPFHKTLDKVNRMAVPTQKKVGKVQESPNACPKKGQLSHYVEVNDHQRLLTKRRGGANNAEEIGAKDAEECMDACDSPIRLSTCNSAVFSAAHRCELSSSAANHSAPDSLIIAPKFKYMEKICLDASLSRGDKRHHFPAMIGHILVGHVQEVHNAGTLSECIKACLLAETSYGFVCKSMMFYPTDADQNCLMNSESRHTQPDVFVQEDPNVHMLYVDIEQHRGPPSPLPLSDDDDQQRRFKDSPIRETEAEKEWTRWSRCLNSTSSEALMAAGMRHRYLKCKEAKDVRKCPKESIPCKKFVKPLRIERIWRAAPSSSSSQGTEQSISRIPEDQPTAKTMMTTTATDGGMPTECLAVRNAFGQKRCPYGMRWNGSNQREFCTKPVDC